MSLKDNNNAQIIWKLMQSWNGDQIESSISEAFDVRL